MPLADNGLLVDGLTETLLESLLNSLPKQHEPVDPDSTRLATPDPANDGSQAGQDQPAPLRWSAWMTGNQLPWRYWNFTLQQNNTPPGAFNVWDGVHTCLHLMVDLYNAFGKSTVWRHPTWTIIDLSHTNNLWHGWGCHWCSFYGGFLDGGSGPNNIWSKCSCPTVWKTTVSPS